MKLAFFEGENMLGVGFISEPISCLYMCPDCGEIWGREIVLNSPSTFGCRSILCPEHSVPGRSPPLFSENEPRFWVRTLPNEVLVRDFLLLCELNDKS